jgi:hypothetical protein
MYFVFGFLISIAALAAAVFFSWVVFRLANGVEDSDPRELEQQLDIPISWRMAVQLSSRVHAVDHCRYCGSQVRVGAALCPQCGGPQ